MSLGPRGRREMQIRRMCNGFSGFVSLSLESSIVMLCSHFTPFPNCLSSFFPLVACHLCVPKRMSVPESL